MMMDLPKPSLWIVVPAYNEEPRIADTLRKLTAFQPRVVVIDDGSVDRTSERALENDVVVLRHLLNCGQGAALQTGIEYALSQGADILVTFDGDGQHGADDIERLIAPVKSGKFEVALGSRFLGEAKGITWTRWLVLKAGVLFTRIFSQIQVTDTHNGFRAFSRAAAQKIRITQNRMAHASEILDQIREHGLSFTEVPVTIHYSAASFAKGQSSWNAFKIVGQLLLGRILR